VDIDAVAIGHDLARGTSAFRRAKPGEVVTVAGGAAGQPEPDWETPAVDAGAQRHPEPAAVT
jgi:single-strand DNA-binding protein